MSDKKDPAKEKVGSEAAIERTLTPAAEAALLVPALRLELVEAVIFMTKEAPGDMNHEALAVAFHALAQAENLDPNRLEILEEKVRRLEEMDRLAEAQYEPDGSLRMG
jgi:hypothetical protein